MKKSLNVLLVVGILVGVGGVIWSLGGMYYTLHESIVEGSCDQSLHSTCTAWVKVSEEPREVVRAWIDDDDSHEKILLFVEIVDGSGRRTESYEWVVDRRIDTKFWTCGIRKVEIIRGSLVVQTVTPKIIGGCPQEK